MLFQCGECPVNAQQRHRFYKVSVETEGQRWCLRKLKEEEEEKKPSLFSEIVAWTPSHHLHNVQLSKCYLYQSQEALRSPQRVTQRKRIRLFLFSPAALETPNEETKLEVQSRFTQRYHISLKDTKGSHQRTLPWHPKSPICLPKKTSCPHPSSSGDK